MPTMIRVIETKEGVARYDGKLLANVPKIHELPPEVLRDTGGLFFPRHNGLVPPSASCWSVLRVVLRRR